MQPINNAQIYNNYYNTLKINGNSDAVKINKQGQYAQYPQYQQYGQYPLMPNNAINPTLVNPKIPTNYSYLGSLKSPLGDDIHTYMLSSGQRVAIVPREGTTILKTFVDSGSMNEVDKIRGVSHFVEHSLFNGSSKLAPGQLFKDVVKMGASTNASTDYAQTDYYISSGLMAPKDFSRALEMHADMILKPLFLADMIEREKAPVTSEISMVQDNPINQAANEVIRNLFQINSTSSELVAGSIETVNNLDKPTVEGYWKKHYTPDSLYTVVVGEVNPQDAIEQIAREFNQKPAVRANDIHKEALTPINAPKRIDIKSPTSNSTNVIMAFAAPSASNLKDTLAVEALGVLLNGYSNSRLSSKLSESNSYSFLNLQKVGLKKEDPQALFVQLSTVANNEQKALDDFYSTILELNTVPPSDFEMQAVKNRLIKDFSVAFEDSQALCEAIGAGFMDGNLSDISQIKNIINSLTPYDLVTAANKYVDLNKVSMAVVHPQNVTDEQIYKNHTQGRFSKISTAKDPSSTISFGSRKIDTTGVKQYDLANNTSLVMNNSDKTDVCYLNWRLTSLDSIPKNLAVPYILTELLNSGSAFRTKNDVVNQNMLSGVDFDFDSNGFQILATADCMKKDLSSTMDLLNEVMYSPNFSKKDFNSAVKKVKNYFVSMEKNGSSNMLVELYPGYFGSTREIIDGLNKMTIGDVQKHYNDMILNSSSNYVVSAPFEKNPELSQMTINKASISPSVFKDFTPVLKNVFTPNTQTKVIVDTAELSQAQILQTYSFKMSGNIEDEVKFELINEILGGSPASRLFTNLREKEKLAYSVSSSVQSFEDTGILTMAITTTTDNKKQNEIKYDNLQKSLQGFQAQVNEFLSNPVSQEELDSAKMQLKQDIAKQTELASIETDLLSMNMTRPYGIKRIDEYVKAIDKITIADLKAAATHIFTNKPTISVLASNDTLNNQMPYLNTLGTVNQAG